MIEIVISIFLLTGAGLSVLGSIGIIRFPDVYGRLHAATKSATLGVISIITGVFLYFLMNGIFVGKLLLTIIFVFLTAPVAAFMIARSAYNTQVKMSDQSNQDDLAEAIKEQNRDQ
ncbi:monovalent cation/H(+) antiporter subunit G [Salisediminibacterium halotolerans]|uniref:monovalent cation/H(+) antiporter subunit G n=1 Tax=Salisediminibacterium halotolerans TaxID=517425 RepID=UPI000EB1D3DA|nr:monovalent cation/H(+) antiporter subunit G [Salisediminibacterium halotolerans]RLJ78192.1 multisubunit sodium/proton antiporter MrpG subunit [Actinophytocola xinjiangensis]RPE88469.1 multisubunit sodium/proton antiporter MrpG subunit [Salisediminibacterium halotolerans]TWG37169.1 multisubunit sodium/proton antiporter MrpG subunit [Salisediminibacterium halotolerans]GEL08647.1 Na+/H+ antiporter subunit G [Salisediminibacterium halotolerans]